MSFYIRHTVISRRYQKIFCAVFYLLPHFYFNTFYQGCLTHGLHNSGSSQYGNPAFNPKTRIKGSDCSFFSLRHTDRYPKTTLVICLTADFFYFFLYHSTGNLVNRCTPHRLLQSLFCNSSHTCATVDHNPGRCCFFYFCINL